MDLDSRVDARVVANVDIRMDRHMAGRTNTDWTENRIPISRHAWGRRDKKYNNVSQSLIDSIHYIQPSGLDFQHRNTHTYTHTKENIKVALRQLYCALRNDKTQHKFWLKAK